MFAEQASGLASGLAVGKKKKNNETYIIASKAKVVTPDSLSSENYQLDFEMSEKKMIF